MTAVLDPAPTPGVGYFTYKNAAVYTSLSVSQLRKFASEGQLATKRVGVRVLVARADLDNLIEGLQQTPRNKAVSARQAACKSVT